MNPHLVKRSLRLAGHPTSVALEAEFWAVLEAAALQRGVSLAVLVAEQDAARGTQPWPAGCASPPWRCIPEACAAGPQIRCS
jgi:hypothetical protein